MIGTIIFPVASAVILIYSFPSLRNPRSHGFWRFFAFESILALILANVEHWFKNPFSILQIFSWLLLTGALFLVIHGFYLLRIVGEPRGDFENTTTLVRIGAYKYIRHPLYASLLYLGWGAFLKDISSFSDMLVILATFFLIATAKSEERENLAKFGAEYEEYMNETKMFLPFIF